MNGEESDDQESIVKASISAIPWGKTMDDKARLARVRVWVERIKEEMIGLVTNDDTYWRLQHEVIAKNHRLLQMRSPFFDLLNSSYVQATASAIRRLTEKQNKGKTNISLRIILEELQSCSAALGGALRLKEVDEDIGLVDAIGNRIKTFVDQTVAHCDRRALESLPDENLPKFKDLREGVSGLGELFRKYYSVLESVDTDLKMGYRDDFNLFTFAWCQDETQRLHDQNPSG